MFEMKIKYSDVFVDEEGKQLHKVLMFFENAGEELYSSTIEFN